MIIIKIEVHPGGNLARSYEIARGEIENVSEIIEGVAQYSVKWSQKTADGSKEFKKTISHNRKNSILKLIKKSIP
jgi:hypothetical protein